MATAPSAAVTSEAVVEAELPAAVASLIKHEFAFHLQWPALTLGVVLENSTTCVNEEWLTAIEAMPTRHVFHAHVEDVLERKAGICAHLRFVQTAAEQHISLHDINFYLVRSSALKAVPTPPEMREMLLHTFHDFRPKSEQVVELVAFSAGTEISEKLVDALAAFLDTETFRREYENVRVAHCKDFRGYVPYTAIAPRGKLTFFVTTYSWLDNRRQFRDFMTVLERRVLEDVAGHAVAVDREPDPRVPASVYCTASSVLYVNDIVTACVARFFGCNARMDSFHRFDMLRADTEQLLAAVRAAFAKLRDAELRPLAIRASNE
ncbi:RNA polymerase subunit RPO35-like protein [Seal parapoxvirus]|uniref:DNA-directed RNA polymerase 35 kDa subunit n=1 Tax=Seal parapoxvirus TaxID=187984 RepID=A0A1Z3GCQ5_9POXV|nr:RNA polymerase subunit RPO35-like protein [Seal parapoxvirus]ASC55542.1 RNA polymerase subunit RPO35-like protein [Seal parapoxvirus]